MWLVVGAVVAAAVVVGTVAVLEFYSVPPFCSIPSAASGHECWAGVDYQYETVAGPNGTNAPEVVPFAGETFSLRGWAGNASYGVEVNVSDPAGPHGTLSLVGCCLEGSGTWQTVIGPGNRFGVQAPGEALGHIRLLVRA